MVEFSLRVDSVVLEVFSSLNDSMIGENLWFVYVYICTHRIYGFVLILETL